METILLEILRELDQADRLDDKLLAKIIRKRNKELGYAEHHYSKKKLLPFYLKVKESDPERWAAWNIDPPMEKKLLRTLQVKPRRTASGVATITVITKPWKCSSNCLYCPNDLRMPKSYLSDEPACQRAERNYFDPYLQTVSRLRALTQMGHATDKIELIILGGTWSDYPEEYQIWFMKELFRALNDGDAAEENSGERRNYYKAKGLSTSSEDLEAFVKEKQRAVNDGVLTYNQAIDQLYGQNDAWKGIAEEQISDFDELFAQHALNETAPHRVVGLVIETRPDTITAKTLTLFRQFGCTKVQIGIQSLDPCVLKLNNRTIGIEKIQESFELLRVFGFKIHAHFMVNLYGSSCDHDIRDYKRFITEKPYIPDEVKLYPCSLVEGTGLHAHYDDRSWQPYSETELIKVLATDTVTTPLYIRISRMIRDISSHDILAGNKKTNLRQMVEGTIQEEGSPITEIRYREINTGEAALDDLSLETLPYETTVTHEYFLQWVTPENKIVGFLRLSLPKAEYVSRHRLASPIGPREAMIREVHVYGKVAKLHKSGDGAQHLGLGKQLIEAACNIARDQGYEKINVISSVGTREYYRNIGFVDTELYQQMTLS